MVRRATAASAQTPHLDGKFVVDVQRGRFDGDVCLSRRTPDSSRTFTLNRGLNIREVHDGVYNSVGVGDGTRDTLAEEPGPEGLRLTSCPEL